MSWPTSRFDPGQPVLREGEARSNHILSALPEPYWTTWKRWLEPVAMRIGDVLHEAGDRLRYVYFPLNATVSLNNVLANGAGTQIGIVGREGVVGITAFLGGGPLGTRAVVQSPGQGVRLDAALAKDEFGRGGAPMEVLLRYTSALMAQMAQTAVCNRYHTAEQQVCRWLLHSLDRVDGHELQTTQDAAQKLRQSGAVKHGRGRMLVLDRGILERMTCECYAAVKQRYDEWLRPVDAPA